MRYKIISVCWVCVLLLGACSQSSAQSKVRVSEASTRIEFQSDSAVITLPVENISREKISACIVLQLVDPKGVVRAQDEFTEILNPGVNKTRKTLALGSRFDADHGPEDLFLYRLRYSVAPISLDQTGLGRAEGVMSVSEAAPQFFELHIAAPDLVKAGHRYSIRVRAIHPISTRPEPGVVLQASLDTDDSAQKPMLTAKSMTNKDGFASLEFTLPEKLDTDEIDVEVTGKRGEFTAMGDTTLRIANEASASLSTDKPLYQPGQPLHMRVLAFDENRKALAGQPVDLEISDPEGTLMYRTTQTTSRFGIAAADWQIPQNVRLGNFQISAKFQDDHYQQARGYAQVKISRYELPTFTVNVKPDRPYYLEGQNAEVEVRAEYLYGEPVRRGHIRVVQETHREWNYKEQKWDIDEAALYEGEADSQGKYVAHVDLSKDEDGLEDTERYKDVSYSAYFTDAVTGRVEERRFDLRLTRDPIHIYMISGQPQVGYPRQFFISTDYADGTPAECDVQITWKRGETDANGNMLAKAVEQPLRRVHTNRYGVAKVSQLNIPMSGDAEESHLLFVAKDQKGVLGHQTERVWRYDEPAVIVATNKTLYQPGDPIEVQIASSEPEATLIVDVVQGWTLVRSGTVRLHHGHGGLVIEPSEKFQDEVAIVAYALGLHAGSDRWETSVVGTHIVLFPKNHEMNLNLQFTKSSYLPGENAAANVRLVGPNGEASRGAIGMVVVDKAVEERQRTDRDLRRNYGFLGYRNLRPDMDDVSGVRRSYLDKVDLSTPLPEGLELVAEILLQQYSYAVPRFFTSPSSDGNVTSMFATEIDPQLKALRMALQRHYELTGEYPKTEAMLEGVLADEGIKFHDVRDPWGTPYYVQFSVNSYLDVLEISTAGPDKKVASEDDASVLRMEWPYFKKHSEAIGRAVTDFHRR